MKRNISKLFDQSFLFTSESRAFRAALSYTHHIVCHRPPPPPEEPEPMDESGIAPQFSYRETVTKELEQDIYSLHKKLTQKQKLETSAAEVAHLPELTEDDFVKFYQALQSWSVEGQALENETLMIEGSRSSQKGLPVPTYYQDIMEVPVDERILSAEERLEIMTNLIGRIGPVDDEGQSTYTEPASQGVHSTEAEPVATASPTDSTQVNVSATAEATDIQALQGSAAAVQALDAIDIIAQSVDLQAPTSTTSPPLSLGLIRPVEWDAILKEFIEHDDVKSIERTFTLMEKLGHAVEGDTIREVLRRFAFNGAPEAVMEILDNREKTSKLYSESLSVQTV